MDRDYPTEAARAIRFMACPWDQLPSLDPPPPPGDHERVLRERDARRRQAEKASS